MSVFQVGRNGAIGWQGVHGRWTDVDQFVGKDTKNILNNSFSGMLNRQKQGNYR